MKERKPPPSRTLSSNKMVRVVAEISINSPTASSSDRYKYRYGCGQGSCYNNQRTIYRRPAPPTGEKMSQKQSEKQPLLVNGDDADDNIIDTIDIGAAIIDDRFIKIDEVVDRINTVVGERRNMIETQQMREINRNSEKEKEKEKEKLKEINHKLGTLIYRSRTGDLFKAYHSIHVTEFVVVDKKNGQCVKNKTQKIFWNDRIFETKQDWFSEMAKLSYSKADETMKIVRCE